MRLSSVPVRGRAVSSAPGAAAPAAARDRLHNIRKGAEALKFEQTYSVHPFALAWLPWRVDERVTVVHAPRETFCGGGAWALPSGDLALAATRSECFMHLRSSCWLGGESHR